MGEQSISQLFRQLDPLFVQKYGAQWKRNTPAAIVTPSVGAGAASTALTQHAGLDWIEAHPTKDPAVNRTRTYYSINFGIIGGAGVDESNNILAMLNAVGLAGGGTVVICAVDPADPIHIAKTISIYYSNVHVVFPPGQVLTYEDKASLRIMGDYAQITRKIDGTAMKLHVDSTVVSNETVLELSATDTALMDAEANPALRIVRVGDKIVVRGQNDASGKSIEKDTTFVKALAKVGSYWQITCTDELDYTFKPTYPASEWPADLTTGTTIYVIEGSLITVNTDVNDTVVTVTDGTVFSVGDMVEVGDNRNEYVMNASAITGAGNPYKNPANLEQAQIIAISGNDITLDHALCRSASTTYYAFMALMVPVVNSTISGARISYVADGIRSANALQITYAMDCHIHDCYVYGLGGRKGHGLRISYSYKCTAYRNHIVGALYTGSGEGYGITIYYATLIMVDNNYISGCRHNILLQLATLAKVISNTSIDDRISGIDLHGVYSVYCTIQNNSVTRSSLNTSDSTKSGGIRIGNTSHTGGDHYNVIQGNTVTNYAHTDCDGIDIFAASVGNQIIDNTIIDCYTGLRFGLNSKQITPVQTIDNTLVQNNRFVRCSSRTVEIIAQPVYDNVVSNGKFSNITMIDNVSNGNNRHFEITGVVTNLGVTNVIMSGNKIINPTNVTTTYYGVSVKYTAGFVHIYDNDVSKAQRGIYLQGNGVCHVVGNKTANTVQTDPFTDGTGNTSVNYVDAMSGGGSGVFGGTISSVGPIVTTGATASFDLYNQATNALSIRLLSDVAGVLRFQNATGVPVNRMTMNATGDLDVAGKIESAGLRVTNIFLPSTGEGMLLGYDPSTNIADITVYDYVGGAYRQFRRNASLHTWFIAGTQKMELDASANLNLVGPFVAKGSTASFDLYNQATNAASIRFFSDVAGVLRMRNLVSATNIGTWDTDGRYQNSGGAAIARGTNTDGALKISGTTNASHFAYSTDENAYIRGGKSTSDVYVADVGSGNVIMGQAGAGVVSAAGAMTVGGNHRVVGSTTLNSSGYRYYYDENGITFGVAAIDILPNNTGRARGVMIYGFATNSGGGVGEIRQMVSSGLPSDTTIGTDVLRITCTTGGKVSIVHYSHTGGSPQGTFSVSIDIYWAND